MSIDKLIKFTSTLMMFGGVTMIGVGIILACKQAVEESLKEKET